MSEPKTAPIPAVDDIHLDKKDSRVDVESDIKNGTVSDLDEAEVFLQQHGIDHARLDELMADESRLKKLRKKVDWSLMPLLCGTYLLQYVDKQALGYSAVFDLFTSTGMTGDQYSWMARYVNHESLMASFKTNNV